MTAPSHARLRDGTPRATRREKDRALWLERTGKAGVFALFYEYFPEIPSSEYEAMYELSCKLPEDTKKKGGKR